MSPPSVTRSVESVLTADIHRSRCDSKRCPQICEVAVDLLVRNETPGASEPMPLLIKGRDRRRRFMINNVSTTASDPVVPAAATFDDDSSELAVLEESAQPAVRRNDRGMVSAEWAVGIIAAIAIAGVLLAVVTSGPVKAALLKFILLVIHSFSGFMN